MKSRSALTFSFPYLIEFVDCNVMECIAQRLADLEEMYNRKEYYFHSFFLYYRRNVEHSLDGIDDRLLEQLDPLRLC